MCREQNLVERMQKACYCFNDTALYTVLEKCACTEEEMLTRLKGVILIVQVQSCGS